MKEIFQIKFLKFCCTSKTVLFCCLSTHYVFNDLIGFQMQARIDLLYATTLFLLKVITQQTIHNIRNATEVKRKSHWENIIKSDIELVLDQTTLFERFSAKYLVQFYICFKVWKI